MDVDTIVSVSTAPGVGAIAVVRLSGPRACEVLTRVTRELDEMPEPRRATLVGIVDPDNGEELDQGLVTYFPGPDSYTGEDVVELSCHGGWLVPRLVVDACVRGGARVAEPGEFTRRAYLHGKLDLVQVEAVADLIESRNRALHRAALGQLERGLSRRVGALREALVRLEAMLVHHLDFPEEDDAPVPTDQIAAAAADIMRGMDAMLATAPEGALLREGAVVVLAGRPNVGKSSLYNALLGEERAIVTDLPGTTRDALDATVQLGGYPFRLVDTAGLRDAQGEIERLGIEVTHRFLERADVVLLCVEASTGLGAEERAFAEAMSDVPVVLLETKADLASASGPGQVRSGGGSEAGDTTGGDVRPSPGDEVAHRVRISTVTGEGLERLRSLLPELVYASVVEAGDETPVLTRERQARGLRKARSEVEAFRASLQNGLPAEVAATHLRGAETALEELLGVISVDDVLTAVFAEFCVGK